MTERAKTKEMTNFTRHASFLGGIFLLHGKESRGHNPTRKSGWFLSRKRPKEGERVARGHFHERVGESPRREKNLAPADIRFVVSFPRYGRLKSELLFERNLHVRFRFCSSAIY